MHQGEGNEAGDLGGGGHIGLSTSRVYPLAIKEMASDGKTS